MTINLNAPNVLTAPLLIGAPVRTTNGSTDSLPALTENGGNPASVLAEFKGTDGGIVLPRMTGAQRDALNPTAGMLIYNTDTNKANLYTNAWEVITSA